MISTSNNSVAGASEEYDVAGASEEYDKETRR
jgi:hypothetical protein